MCNKCKRYGVQGSATDFLLCAVSIRYDVPIFSSDDDFARYAKLIDIRLHEAV